MFDFGSLLKEKREAKGFTQLMLAQKIGMSPVQLCKIERNKTSPTLDTVERLRRKIREELRAYYKAHPKAMEPEPRMTSLKIGVREKLLKMEVARKDMKR